MVDFKNSRLTSALSYGLVCQTHEARHDQVHKQHIHSCSDRGQHYSDGWVCDPCQLWRVPDPDRRGLQLATRRIFTGDRDPKPVLGDWSAVVFRDWRKVRGPPSNYPWIILLRSRVGFHDPLRNTRFYASREYADRFWRRRNGLWRNFGYGRSCGKR